MAVAKKIQLTPTPDTVRSSWVRQELLPVIFGISTEAARKYRSQGKWLQGKHWRRDPANRVVYNTIEIELWLGGN
ncbi:MULTISPECIES: DNA-binding protein [Pseudomonas]|uniref:DNA-binding protein n=1 Tax=Pseudomonas TaxID=286 RepID=UPI0009EB4F26|nr:MULTISPECIES: DNA-binding protein [Pseudomonas]